MVSTVDSEIEVLEVMNDVLLRNVLICKSVHRYTRDEFGTFTCLVKHNPKINTLKKYNVYIHPLLCTAVEPRTAPPPLRRRNLVCNWPIPKIFPKTMFFVDM